VTGLAAEAAIAARAGLVPVCAGGAPERTAAALAKALETTASARPLAIISFGLAGGLAPGVAAGALFAPDAVLAGAGRYPVDPVWQRRLAETGAAGGTLYGATRICGSAAEKAALFAASGALAVDLESAVVARAAGAAGLPFAVLRAIADPAERDLPQAALLPLRPDGRPDLGAVIGSLVRAPGQLPGLIGTAWQARQAFRSLELALARLKPALAAL
jgi:hopanoid-associated phosphorylase